MHLLFGLARTRTISEVVERVKTSSSKWIKTKDPRFVDFYWQAGYGAFSVSQSNVPVVRRYIENQVAHHRKVGFQDEFRAFLRKYEISFDERYVWD